MHLNLKEIIILFKYPPIVQKANIQKDKIYY